MEWIWNEICTQKFTPKIILNYSIFSFLWAHTAPLFFNMHLIVLCSEKSTQKKLGRWVCILLGVFFCRRRKLISSCKSDSFIPLTHKKKIRICIKLRENLEHTWGLCSTVMNDNCSANLNGWKMSSQGKWSIIYVRAHKRKLFFYLPFCFGMDNSIS